MGANGLEERVGTLLAQHREELEQLVDEALERELAQLVAERLHARNGNGTTRAAEPATTTTKVCNRCNRNLPTSAFDPRRGTCRQCRQQQHREREQRRAAAVTEPPRTDPDPSA